MIDAIFFFPGYDHQRSENSAEQEGRGYTPGTGPRHRQGNVSASGGRLGANPAGRQRATVLEFSEDSARFRSGGHAFR